jgi:hypothetical protein
MPVLDRKMATLATPIIDVSISITPFDWLQSTRMIDIVLHYVVAQLSGLISIILICLAEKLGSNADIAIVYHRNYYRLIMGK